MSNTPSHGSDVQETPDWWKASDGRFYPPELHPGYVKPADSAPASSEPSLADRLRAEADRVGDEAAAAADAGVGSMTSPRDTVGDPVGPAGGASAAGMPLTSDSIDPRATMPQIPAAAPGLGQTVIQAPSTPPSPGAPPSMPPSPGAPPSMPPSMPPSPGAPPSMPPSMPPSPGAPPSMPPSMPPSPGAPPSMPPGMPPSPGAPPAMPPGMPPAPGAPAGLPPAPSGMPPSPGAPPGMPPAPSGAPAMPPGPGTPAPVVTQGPGGITYTAPAEPVSTGMPGGMPGMAPVSSGMDIQPPVGLATSKASSGTSGLIALIAGAAAIAGSLLQWGKGAVTGIDGVEKAIIEVPGFDSSGLITAIAGGVLILAGILFFMGVPKQLNWAILAFLGGAVIVGAVVFSMIDIGDLSNRYAAQWQAEGLASAGDVISTSADIGLWITGAGGVLGVLAAPFANRS